MSLMEQAEQLDDRRKPESCERIEKSDDLSLTYYGVEVRTVDELLAHAKVDLRLWEVVEQRVNNWEVAGKKSRGQDESKRWIGDELWKTGLRQITVKLKRRAPKVVQDGIRELVADIKPLAPIKRQSKPSDSTPHMMEVGIYDHHFGKLAWKSEVGKDYDLAIAEASFCDAIDAMLARAKGFNVEKILMPVGNDFFNVNDWSGMTTAGTRVDSTDDRLPKVFRIGAKCMRYAIAQALKIADVDVFWIPGNHDTHTSWYLVETLSAYFENNPRVTFDNGPMVRKYRAYGPALLGYVHGDELPPNTLPTLMATEEPQLWAASQFRTWRLGHWHKRKEVRHTVGDTFNGVEVRIMPSLCGTDAWHYRKGFTGNARMAECWLWSRTDGPVGHFVINAKDEPVPKRGKGA
jgi:hypothetical protein